MFRQERFEDPGPVKTLLGSPKLALLWLPIRLYVGYQWLTAGLEKIESPAWTRTGTALQGFWLGATKVDAGAKGAAVHYGWFHDFLKYMLDNHWYTWFAKLIAFGEAAIGIGLIVGAFVGVAAFFGALMNFNFMLAGSASTNPVLFALAIFLVLGWKVAGFIGTPWKLGHFKEIGQRSAARAASFGTFAIAFLAAAGIGILATHQYSLTHPLVGYIVCLAAVVIAWLITEAVVFATHTFGAGESSTEQRPLTIGRRAI